MKKKLALISAILIFVVGLAIMCYPLFSSVVNNIASRNQAEEYTKKTQQMSTKEQNKLFKQAEVYNQSLTNNAIITDPFDEKAYKKIGAYYSQTFNVDNTGLICYIDIPKINVYLPVYHGTTDKILEKGAGHLQNTSLPIGGTSTHSVISAHTGFPTQTFFDYLTELKKGDEFYIHILNKTLKYEVDSIKVVLPNEKDDLRIIHGEDHITLLTCTPYGINTHRLLVRGKRVSYDDSKYVYSSAKPFSPSNDGLYIFGYRIPYWIVITFICCFISVVCALVTIKIRKSKGNKAEHIKDGE